SSRFKSTVLQSRSSAFLKRRRWQQDYLSRRHHHSSDEIEQTTTAYSSGRREALRSLSSRDEMLDACPRAVEEVRNLGKSEPPKWATTRIGQNRRTRSQSKSSKTGERERVGMNRTEKEKEIASTLFGAERGRG